MNKGILIAMSTLLAAALIIVGGLYGIEVGKRNKANTQITALEAEVASLQTQLAAEQADAASLQNQLTTEKTIADSLQTQLTTANGKVSSLTADLATANAKVTSTQASLDKANADLTAAKAANTNLTAELTKVKDPRHFNSVQELTDWLAKDDTNTNSAYSSLTTAARAYVLQVKALRDGYLLPAQLALAQLPDSTYVILGANLAIVGADTYSVNPATDAISLVISFATALPSHPLPLS